MKNLFVADGGPFVSQADKNPDVDDPRAVVADERLHRGAARRRGRYDATTRERPRPRRRGHDSSPTRRVLGAVRMLQALGARAPVAAALAGDRARSRPVAGDAQRRCRPRRSSSRARVDDACACWSTTSFRATSARAAPPTRRCPEYMDFLLAEKRREAATQVAMRGGLAWLDTECQRALREDVRRRAPTRSAGQVLDDIAWPAQGDAGAWPRRRVLQRFRDLTASGFFSSAMGVEGPRATSATCSNPAATAAPPAALEKLGVSYDVDETREIRRAMTQEKIVPQAARRRVHRQRLQRALPHAGLRAVRDADVLGVWSPNKKNAASAAAARARRSTSATRKPYASIADMVADPGDRRDLALRARTTRASRTSRRSSTRSSAARATLDGHRLREAAGAERRRGEARCAALVEARRTQDGYLENQVFAPQVERARAALGARRGDAPAGRTSRARRRSTAARTCPGSGRASCRAAACSTT